MSIKASDYNQYDIVIVGAGPSAMGLLYGLLLPYTRESNTPVLSPEQHHLTPPFTVAVVERGEASTIALHHSINTEDPRRWGYAAFASNSSSVFYTKPQSCLNNRMIGVPVGKGVGGTSNINACLVCQPLADDFEADSSALFPDRASLWTPDVILTAARTLERVMDKNGALTRRRNWLLNVRSRSRIQDAHLLDQPLLCSDAITLLARTTSSDRTIRTNYYEALIQPLLEANPHLNASITFLTDFSVERILFTKPQQSYCKATGLECSYRGSDGTTQYCRIDAQQYVILCAGAVLSPALLLASGLGHSSTLEKAGIIPLFDIEKKSDRIGIEPWKGVGKGLLDHMILPRFFLIQPSAWNRHTETDYAYPIGKSNSQHLIFHPSVNGVQGWVTIDLPENNIAHHGKDRCLIKVFDGSATPWLLPEMAFSTLHRPNLPMIVLAWVLKRMLQFLCSLYPVKYFIQHYTRLVAICLMSPKSKGSVTLNRKKYIEPSSSNFSRLSEFDIVVDPAYLTHPQDLDSLQRGWKYAEGLMAAQNSIEILPGLYRYLISRKNDHGWFKSYASNFANPFFHWSSSLRLNRSSNHREIVIADDKEEEQNYVLEDDLRVRSTANVYVCCASAFPNPISVPTALTCTALGFVLATRILNRKMKVD